ncbi:MAG: transglutaminase family protein [Desulfobacteraceae bacterium]
MTDTRTETTENSLKQTCYIDSDHQRIVAFIKPHINAGSSIRTAVNIFFVVRDEILYDPYHIRLDPSHMKASTILERGKGYCVAKAVLLAACLRAAGIPAKLCFADVKNHITTEKLKEAMQTDVFYYHGYCLVYLDGNWVKATPAFNLSLCEKFGIKPLDFNGRDDSIFHEYDTKGQRHMEYIREHGCYDDLPLEEIVESFRTNYPGFREHFPIKEENSGPSFENEAEPIP